MATSEGSQGQILTPAGSWGRRCIGAEFPSTCLLCSPESSSCLALMCKLPLALRSRGGGCCCCAGVSRPPQWHFRMYGKIVHVCAPSGVELMSTQACKMIVLSCLCKEVDLRCALLELEFQKNSWSSIMVWEQLNDILCLKWRIHLRLQENVGCQ